MYKMVCGYDHYTPSIIQVDSGSLTVENCEIHCSLVTSADVTIQNSQYYAYSLNERYFVYPVGSETLPAIQIENASNITVLIQRSLIVSEYYEGIHFQNVQDAQVDIKDSIIRSGRRTNFRFGSIQEGEDGMYLENCDTVQINLYDSVVNAGDSGPERGTGPVGPYEPGGNGIYVKDSNVLISGGVVMGGKGYDGDVSYSWLVHDYDASDGGHGMVLENSTVRIEDVILIPGKGGKEDEKEGYRKVEAGQPGLPVVLDENSRVIEVTEVGDWSIY